VSDRRFTPDPALVREERPAALARPVTDLCRRPEGRRDRQLLLGEAVTQLGRQGDWAYLQAAKDGYCGWVPAAALGPATDPTHRISAPASHAYSAPDLKSPERLALSHGSRLTVTGESGAFAETAQGFVPRQHLAPLDSREDDPAAVAALFVGAPYLWGGNAIWGIDCSGLIQAALLACGIPCPGDSDVQMALGQPASSPCRRNDLLFWKGHVALVVDAERLIHANAGSMSTRYEGIEEAKARILAQGEGPVTAHRRL